jgi:predicted permease
VLPIFLVAGVGFVLARHLRVDVRVVSRVAFNALSPCLVFTLLMRTSIGAGEFGRLGLFSVASILGIGLIAWLVALLLRLDRATATAFLMVIMFSNTGNFGLSAIMLAFGSDALARGTVYFVISSSLMYTLGVFLAQVGAAPPPSPARASRELRRDLAEAADAQERAAEAGCRRPRRVIDALRGILKVPTVYGVALAVVCLATGLRLPLPVKVGVDMLGDAALPVMMLVLGMQFERSRRPERPALVAIASVLTLVVSPLLAFALADAIGLTGTARQASVLEASMPAAIVTTILALEYDASPSFVTAVVFVTTLASPLTVTVIIAMLK